MGPEAELDAMIAKFTPELGASAHRVLARMNALFPQAVRLVYDNYNALAVGYAPDTKVSNGIFSIAIYPRWVSLFFLQGARLADPDRLLKGSGSTVRHVVLTGAGDFDDPKLQSLMATAVIEARVPFPAEGEGPLIIKSVSAKQRPRRPA